MKDGARGIVLLKTDTKYRAACQKTCCRLNVERPFDIQSTLSTSTKSTMWNSTLSLAVCTGPNSVVLRVTINF